MDPILCLLTLVPDSGTDACPHHSNQAQDQTVSPSVVQLSAGPLSCPKRHI